MTQITTRDTLENTPLAPVQPDAPVGEVSAVNRVVTLAKCLRCDFEWMPRRPDPLKCARCGTPLWNVPRAQQLPGKPAPTRKGKPRGKPLAVGFDERRKPRGKAKPKSDSKAAPEAK